MWLVGIKSCADSLYNLIYIWEGCEPKWYIYHWVTDEYKYFTVYVCLGSQMDMQNKLFSLTITPCYLYGVYGPTNNAVTEAEWGEVEKLCIVSNRK